MTGFLLFALAAMLGWEVVQFGRALLTRKVRRITFRALYVTPDEDSWGFWAATAYHGFAVLFLAWMVFLWVQQPGIVI
jgi:hypothetical protein